jgi:flagellar hook-basal body complex protein FliE
MNVGPVAPFPPLVPSAGASAAQGPAAPESGGSFGQTVAKAVESLDAQQKGADREIARAVTGESPDLHRTVVALQTADLSFQFALQVRNKLVGAYEEIMRMQV